MSQFRSAAFQFGEGSAKTFETYGIDILGILPKGIAVLLMIMSGIINAELAHDLAEFLNMVGLPQHDHLPLQLADADAALI